MSFKAEAPHDWRASDIDDDVLVGSSKSSFIFEGLPNGPKGAEAQY
jgi:hypothetical protein